MIPFYKHNLKKRNYIKNVIKTSYLTSGPVCQRVEGLLSKKFNKKFVNLTNSWTNASLALMLALNIKKNDEIIIPACTFVACANIIEMVGAKVVFADINPETKLMDIEDCLKKITEKTRAIMPVHLYGNLFPTHILKKKLKRKIIIIEDSAHAFCGEYNGKNLGYYSDFLIFSFYATKSITCGEGGAILSNNRRIMEQIRSISNNGMTKPAFKRFENNKYKAWDVMKCGFKANLSDLNASLLNEQIINYAKIARNKRIIYDYFKKKLSKINQIKFPKNFSNKNRDYYLFPIGVEKKYRNKLVEFLLSKKIFVTVNFNSITNLKYYKNKYKNTSCPYSKKWGEETLSLPFHSKISRKEINTIYDVLKNFFKSI